ncbi:MAG: hypothetical protein P4L43_06550 [Syntrophobacteraceae bacterium]|nr:hypothetical protein [Syntrophobacteraceae bacterium]
MKGKRVSDFVGGGKKAGHGKRRGAFRTRLVTAVCCFAITASGTMVAVARQQMSPPGMKYINQKACQAPLPATSSGAILPVNPPDVIPQSLTVPDATGQIGSYQPNGPTTTKSNGFFDTSITTNQRSCFVCHRPDADWEITPQQVSSEYSATGGRSALFAPVDSAVCPNAPLLTFPFLSRLPSIFISMHSMLFKRGDFRIAINAPYNTKAPGYITFNGNGKPEWNIRVLYDPYGCEMDPAYGLPSNQLSVYRRPLNCVNLAYLARTEGTADPNGPPLTTNGQEIMWDSREPDLGTQFINATLYHGQASSAPVAGNGGPVNTAVEFESGLFTAQTYDSQAGDLTDNNGNGPPGGPLAGPVNLYNQTVDLVRSVPTSPIPGFGPFVFDPSGFYGELILSSVPNFVAVAAGAIPAPFMTDYYSSFAGSSNATRASIARGEAIFNGTPIPGENGRTVTFTIYDEPGLNLALGNPATLSTCATCHNGVHVGNDAAAPLHRNGIMDNSDQVSPAALAQINLPVTVMPITYDFPQFGFFCPSGTIPYFSNQVYDPVTCPQTSSNYPYCDEYITTDPGAGLINGKCADLGEMKTPILRGVGARAPYFHGGNAMTLLDVVNFYNARFRIGLTAKDKQDLVNYMNTL